MEAIEEVLTEDPKTRDNKYLWTFMTKTLRKMGFKLWVEFDKNLPSPDAMLTERRTILNKKNKFPQDIKEALPSLEQQMMSAKIEKKESPQRIRI